MACSHGSWGGWEGQPSCCHATCKLWLHFKQSGAQPWTYSTFYNLLIEQIKRMHICFLVFLRKLGQTVSGVPCSQARRRNHSAELKTWISDPPNHHHSILTHEGTAEVDTKILDSRLMITSCLYFETNILFYFLCASGPEMITFRRKTKNAVKQLRESTRHGQGQGDDSLDHSAEWVLNEYKFHWPYDTYRHYFRTFCAFCPSTLPTSPYCAGFTLGGGRMWGKG